MDGTISVVRTLPIDAALVRGMFNGLRRDTPGPATGWNLGAHGSAEVDVDFFPAAPAARPAWTTTARLWDPETVAVVHAIVELSALRADACEITLRPNSPLAPWWSARLPALRDLARAALDELAEELLWHATRDGVAAGDGW